MTPSLRIPKRNFTPGGSYHSYFFLTICTFQDAPDSPKDEASGPGSLVVSGLDGGGGHDEKHRRPRHLLYTTHFPLPQVSKSSVHHNMLLTLCISIF